MRGLRSRAMAARAMSSAKDARLGLEMWLAEAGVLVAPGVQAGGGAWLEAWVSSEAAAVGAHVKRLEAAEAEAAEVEAADQRHAEQQGPKKL